MERFEAHTQYDDLTGTVAVDRADAETFENWLEDQGLLRGDEHLVATEIVFNENGSQSVPQPGIVAYIAEIGERDNLPRLINEGPLHVRLVKISMPLAEFFRFFKRLNMFITYKELNGQRFTYDD